MLLELVATVMFPAEEPGKKALSQRGGFNGQQG